MSKETLVFVIGCIVFFTPFLGVPGHYKKWLLVSLGIILVIIGYSQRRQAFLRSFEHTLGERKSDVFVESVHVREEVSPIPKDRGSFL